MMRPVLVTTTSTSMVGAVWPAGSVAVRCHVFPPSCDPYTMAWPVLLSFEMSQRTPFEVTAVRGSVPPPAPESFSAGAKSVSARGAALASGTTFATAVYVAAAHAEHTARMRQTPLAGETMLARVPNLVYSVEPGDVSAPGGLTMSRMFSFSCVSSVTTTSGTWGAGNVCGGISMSSAKSSQLSGAAQVASYWNGAVPVSGPPDHVTSWPGVSLPPVGSAAPPGTTPATPAASSAATREDAIRRLNTFLSPNGVREMVRPHPPRFLRAAPAGNRLEAVPPLQAYAWRR